MPKLQLGMIIHAAHHGYTVNCVCHIQPLKLVHHLNIQQLGTHKYNKLRHNDFLKVHLWSCNELTFILSHFELLLLSQTEREVGCTAILVL